MALWQYVALRANALLCSARTAIPSSHQHCCLTLWLMLLPMSLSQVIKMDDCVGAAVEARISSMGNGDVMLLENVRFHAGEEVRGPTNQPHS